MTAKKFLYTIRQLLLFDFLYPAIYKKGTKKPLKDKAVFFERRDEKLSDNFQLLYDALKKRGDVETVFLSTGEGRLARAEIEKRKLHFFREIADAKYVFINDSLDLTGCIDIRKGTQIIQLWHACGAFKRFGYSSADKLFGGNIKQLEKHPYHKNFSMVTVSSPEVVWAYAEAFHMEDKKDRILPTGISRTDVFYSSEKIRAAYEKIHRLIPGTKDKKVMLYAPTFRGQVGNAQSPDQMDLFKMKEVLGDEYVLLEKHHPFVKKRPEIPEKLKDFAVDVTDTMSIEELLMVSDICISDYSSLVFEYSLFERPMIFFAYDLENYYDWRGFYYDYPQMTPGPVVKTTQEIIEYVQHLDERFDRQQVVDFREKFMSACDGHATERILDLVLNEKYAE